MVKLKTFFVVVSLTALCAAPALCGFEEAGSGADLSGSEIGNVTAGANLESGLPTGDISAINFSLNGGLLNQQPVDGLPTGQSGVNSAVVNPGGNAAGTEADLRQVHDQYQQRILGVPGVLAVGVGGPDVWSKGPVMLNIYFIDAFDAQKVTAQVLAIPGLAAYKSVIRFIPSGPATSSPSAPQGGMEAVNINAPQAMANAQAMAAQLTPAPVAAPYDLPDQNNSYYDAHTGQYETQASKIGKVLQLALTHPLAAAVKNALPYNTLYQVNNSWDPTGPEVSTVGDDPEAVQAFEPTVIFLANALQNLPVEVLSARLAGMWIRHLYRDKVPVSAEKVYAEGSVLIRVFMDLTGSTAQQWNGDKDEETAENGQNNFATYRHFYWWNQGFNFQDVRQGPYFLQKIIGNQGDPTIFTDARGRQTLFQRAQAGQIAGAAASAAQQTFTDFVENERAARAANPQKYQ